MLKNYLKTALRNLGKNRLHTFINITGLAMGMAVAMLIGLWIWSELTYNHYHKKHGRIARVMQQQQVSGAIATWAAMPAPIGEALRQDYGDYFRHVIMSSWTQPQVLQAGDKRLVKDGNYMEPGAPDMLGLEMIHGTHEGLKDANSILVSASLAQAFWGSTNVMDRIIRVNDKLTVKVTGVYRDIADNSSFAVVSYLMPWDLYVSSFPILQQVLKERNWSMNGLQTFVELADHAGTDRVSASIRDIKLHHVRPEDRKYHPQVFLHPMDKWRLYERFENGVNTGGRIETVWLFGIIGAFVLLLACINFMNLSTARSAKRAKEVGIRKAIGSRRGQLISQFFSESVVTVLLGFLLSLLLVMLALPFFSDVTGRPMHIPWAVPGFWITAMICCLLTATIAGSYPAFYLSAFQPVKVLKGTFRAGRFAALPRKVLVVAQFAVSITLIIGTLIIYGQIQHAKNRPMGYDSDGLVMLRLLTGDVYRHMDAIRADLKSSNAVVEVATSDAPLTQVWNTLGGFDWKGKDPALTVDFPVSTVSTEYGKTVSWQFVAGRDFSPHFASDTTGLVVNEAAVRFMGLEDPVGEIIRWDGRPFHIIGVIKDMVIESPYQQVRPYLFRIAGSHDSYAIMKLNRAMSATAALNKMEAVLRRYAPAQPFDYQFADAVYARKFADEMRMGKLAGSFTILAIFISCMGLFGMALFMAEQRTKEIGIRKVLGASVLNLWHLLSREFLLLVLIALVIAAPIAYYSMQRWLQHYEYRTEISWWVFAVTGIGALLIALVTVSGQSIKAALMNPVKSLRTE